MTQDWTEDPFELNSVWESDVEVQDAMQAVENNLLCLLSSFSGAGSPESSVVELVNFMLWGDTTRKILRRRDAGNYEWLAVLAADASQKIWFYRDDTCDGWLIDTSVTDRVLAVKGGSQAYNVSGGIIAGDWQTPDHQVTEAEMPSHTHTFGSVDYHTHGGSLQTTAGGYSRVQSYSAPTHNHTLGNTGGNTAHNHGSTHRPTATVGTLQYMDL